MSRSKVSQSPAKPSNPSNPNSITVAQAAKDHGVHETTIYSWLGQVAEAALSQSEFAKIQKQNRDLLELVGELTLRFSAAPKRG